MTVNLGETFFSNIPKLFTTLFSLPLWEIFELLPDFFSSLEPQTSFLPDHVYVENKERVYVAENCLIEPGALIQGPVFLGPNTQVRHGAYVRPFTVAMSENVIGHATEIKRSILLPGSKAPHFNYIGDSIVGAQVNLGKGSTLSNFRLDKKEILLKIADERIHTGQNKFGAIIGDDVEIGCHCILNPGVVIGPRSKVYPGCQLQGYYPTNSVVKL